MFAIRLVAKDGGFAFEPSLQDLEDGVIAGLDAMMIRTSGIENITVKVCFIPVL